MYVLQLVKKDIAITLVALCLVFSGTLLGYNPFLKGHTADPEFVVLITSYNNEKFFYRNLDSVVHQKLSVPFHIMYVNDCSTDKTGQLVDAYVRTHNLGSLVTVIHNEKRVGALANQYNVIHTLPDYVIVIQLDGDDFLAHDRVLERELEEYINENVWLTYSQFIYYPEGWIIKSEECSQSVLQTNSFRSYNWITSHLKTFYAGLFKQIKKEDLLYQGDFFPMTGDLAFMFPMLEMACQGHIAFIPEILYVYNHHNPISDHNKDATLQTELCRFIRNMRKYDPIIECLD